jgi:predicted nucleotidyltransferase
MSKKLIRRGAQWAEQMGRARREVLRIGYFGSYARGDWGVGSDLDLIIVVERADQPFERRGARWAIAELPVPADVLVYTEEEWDLRGRQGKRVYRTVMMEGCRVWERQAAR